MTQFGAAKSNLYLTKFNKSKKPKTIYSPNNFKYPNLKKIIAFVHAFSGCDTTSAFFERGKEKIFKAIAPDDELINRAQAFFQPEANPDELWKIALDIVSEIYMLKKST